MSKERTYFFLRFHVITGKKLSPLGVEVLVPSSIDWICDLSIVVDAASCGPFQKKIKKGTGKNDGAGKSNDHCRQNNYTK